MTALRKSAVILIFAVLLTTASYAAALAVRFDFRFAARLTLYEAWLPLGMLLAARMGAYRAFGLDRIDWRFLSVQEGWQMLKAHAASTLVFAAAAGLMRAPMHPRSLIFLEFAFSLLFLWGVYLAARLAGERWYRSVHLPRTPTRAVILGAGFTGHCLMKLLRLQKHACVEVTGVFDDSETCQGMKVHGAPVVGRLAELPEYLSRHKEVTTAFLAIPELSAERRRGVESACGALGIPVKSCSLESLVFDVREVALPSSVEELLQRRTTIDHQEQVAQALRGRRVMVTGAGGSIGSDLVRQILRYQPAAVVLIDKCEYNLYAIEQEIAPLCEGEKAACPSLTCCLADLRDEKRVFEIFKRHHPHFVFHAAAYKHVPLLEANCYEAFQNNVIGTLNLLHAAKRFRAGRFVQISTDKAVAPVNVMGGTKRVCELMVQQVNSPAACRMFDPKGGHRLETAVVRFGNVINSAGSVVPLFKKQILSGGPITVTHPEVERYFMSIQEAANLVLVAGTLGREGEIYMLDMGTPVKVLEVARKMCALYGRRDIPISFVGLRPGEKLTEELYSPLETREETGLSKVFRVCCAEEAGREIFPWVRLVENRLEQLADQRLGAVILERANGERAAACEVSRPPHSQTDLLEGGLYT